MDKKFAVQIYIKKGQVSIKKDSDALSAEDIKKTIRLYGDEGADLLLVLMDYASEEELAVCINELKVITFMSEMPVFVYGPVKSVDDAKKLLTASVKKIIIDIIDENDIALLKALSDRFGSEKLGIGLKELSIVDDNKACLEACADCVYLFGGIKPSEVEKHISLPCMVSLPDVMPEKLLEIMSEENVEGIFGAVIDRNVKEINSLKYLCEDRKISVRRLDAKLSWSELKLNEQGLIPVIAQDYKTNEVLMMAYMNEEAFNQTIKSGKMNYYSRSRKSQWLKGESSGHLQYVKSLYADCDKDTLLAKISQVGAACHTGSYSCFFNEICTK